MTGPTASHYDTVVVGGAALGSSIAYWLSENPDYDGSILVVEQIGRASCRERV